MTPSTTTADRLAFGMNVRLSDDQRQLLERISRQHDLTLSGALRHVLDQELDAPLKRGGPTLREVLHDDDPLTMVIDGERQQVEIESIEHASA